MSRAFEYGLVCLIGAFFIFTVIAPVIHKTADAFNQTAACINHVEDCHG